MRSRSRRATRRRARALLPAFGASLFEAGRLTEATSVLDEAIAQTGDSQVRARAQVERALVRLETETTLVGDESRRVVDDVLPVLVRDGDEAGQGRAWWLRGQVAWRLGSLARADEALCRAAELARSSGDERELFEVLGWRAATAVFGPTPVDEGIDRCEAFRAAVAASPVAEASALNALGALHAMRGDVELADRLFGEANATLDKLGGLGANVSFLEAFARLAAGQPERAEQALRADVDALESMNVSSALATTTGMLAQAVYAQGRFAEAGELCRLTADGAAEDDLVTQIIWRGVQAKVLARDGRCEQAEALAREAVALAEPTDLLSHRADAMLDLAEMLWTCSRAEESGEALGTGIALYDQKGNAAAAARARALDRNRPGDA